VEYVFVGFQCSSFYDFGSLVLDLGNKCCY